MYARRVFGLRICELKKSRIRARASGRAVKIAGSEAAPVSRGEVMRGVITDEPHAQ